MLLVTFLLAFPDVLYYALNRNWLEAGLAYAICTAVVALPLYLFHRWVKLYVWLLMPLGLLAVVSVACVIVYNVNLNFDVLLVIRNTTFAEATELLKGYYLYILAALLFYLFFYAQLIRWSPNYIPSRPALLASLGGLAFLLLTPLLRAKPGTYVEQVKINISSFFPGSMYYAGKLLVQQHATVKAFADNTKNFTFHAQPKSKPEERQIYVLILGETSRYDHWGINGYARPTSPRLATRQQQLVSFSNMSTGAYLTEYSVPMLVTRATATNYDLHYQEKSVVSLFRESGFKTYWLSNQFDYGNIGIHANEAETRLYFSSAYESTKSVHYDLELLGALKKILDKGESKAFIVLHTLGSHYDYDARYPPAYAHFQPTARSVNARPTDVTKKQALINSYDNSIRYTDALVDSTIRMVERQPALSWVNYLSDHGEELFDDSRQQSQHGFPVPSIFVAHIPWFVWLSPDYRRTFPRRLADMEQNKNVALGSQNVFYTLADLGNIRFTGQDSTKSAAAAQLKPQPQLILGGNYKVFDVQNFITPAKP
ncbi:phosphoethanolamine transferase [Hymenobacter sp. BT770]|uniref:phosphoethanolamine transferase n=1 Tax=Hymenobacter sp. BT770 TaxID=2886942 RepID=UPI001D124058|nr:phosphoethanolamine transferase [Hymenobacter sp. BT770]MCC3152805.1 phosphoethanolamine transferase [Hymenobacter sp. BT770]MDO3414880.1 phosphoethanolamine transferase [Hymenobacter sp. BT770]